MTNLKTLATAIAALRAAETPLPDDVVGLVERLRNYSCMHDHLSWRSKCERQAAVALEAQARQLAERDTALIACRDQFQFYANEHFNAGKLEKAATNQTFADTCERALGYPSERSALEGTPDA